MRTGTRKKKNPITEQLEVEDHWHKVYPDVDSLIEKHGISDWTISGVIGRAVETALSSSVFSRSELAENLRKMADSIVPRY